MTPRLLEEEVFQCGPTKGDGGHFLAVLAPELDRQRSRQSPGGNHLDGSGFGGDFNLAFLPDAGGQFFRLVGPQPDILFAQAGAEFGNFS